MKTKIISCFFGLLIFLPAMAQEKTSPEARAFFNKAISQINPRHVGWIKTTATTIQEKNLGEVDAKKMASQYAASGNMSNADIETLILLVMIQVSNDEDEDLKSLMAGIKANMERKKELNELHRQLQKDKQDLSRSEMDSIKFKLLKRPVIQVADKTKFIAPVKMNPVIPARNKQVTTVSAKVTKDEIEKTADEIKLKTDEASDLSETQSLQLQMHMDRKSKMMNTISNLFKKMSDTQDQIIGNLK